MQLSATLDESLGQIHHGAAERRHPAFTALHLLLALVQEPTAAVLLHVCGADGDRLTDRLLHALDRIPSTGRTPPEPDADCQRALAHAVQQIVPGAGRTEVTGADVLVALLAGPRSQAAQWLADEGVTWARAIGQLEAAVAAAQSHAGGEAEVPQLPGSPEQLEQDVHRLRAELARDRDAVLSDFTIALARWGAHLAETGVPVALGLNTEALDLAQELERRGDEDATRMVAGCAINRGTCLLQLRRYAEAVAMAELAAGRFQRLVEQGDTDGLRGRATALTVLSSARREAGALGPALEAALESTRVARRFLQQEPGIPAFWVLAACLANEGAARTETQDLEGAVGVLAEAASLYERMPRDAAGITLSKWVVSLGKLGNGCAAAGRRAEAVAHARRAVELSARLPEHAPALARIRIGALNDLAGRLHEAGEPAQAVAVARQAHDQARLLAREHPHLRIDEAQAAANLGLMLADVGDLAGALQWCEDALALAERAARTHDADPRHLQASLLGNMGLRLGQTGRYAESLRYQQRGLRIARELVGDDARSHTPFLARYLFNTATAHMRIQACEGGLALMQEAHALAVRLADQNAGAHRPLLAAVCGGLSLACGHLARHAEALQHAREAAAAMRELVASHRSAYLHSLAVSLANLGVAESKSGTVQAALQATLEAVALFRELEAGGARDDTAMLTSLSGLAGRWFEAGDAERARQALRECGERLLRTPPADPMRWVELAAGVSSHLDAVEDLRAWHLPLLESLCELRELAHDDEIAGAFVRLQAHAAACAWDRVATLGAPYAPLLEAAAAVLVSTLHSPDLARWLKARGGTGLDELAARKAAVLEADQTLQALLHSAPGLQAADPVRDARVAAQQDRVREARAAFRECRLRLIAADPALGGAFDAAGHSLRHLAGHAGAAAALYLLQIAGDDDGPPRAVGVWVPADGGPIRLLSFPALHGACVQAARRPPLAGTQRRLRNAEAAAFPVTEEAAPVALDELADALRTGFWDRLPGDGPVHVCCHGDLQHLPLALCDATGRARQWPGLPFLRLAGAERAPAPSGVAWLVDHDCAWDGTQPLPMAAVEAGLMRRLLAAHGHGVAAFADEAAAQGPWAGLVACCHARRREAHFDSALELAHAPLDVRSLMSRRVVDRLALLPACHAGETRDDAAGNSLGIAAAFLLGGTQVVVASSKAVADDLMPWLSTLVVWHLVQGLPPHAAALRARREFGTLDFPPAYRAWLQQALPEALRALQPGGAEHRPAARRALDDLADAWPWAGDSLHLFSSDDRLRAASTQSVAAGVLLPPEGDRVRLQANARETAAFLMVYGVA